MMKTNFSGTELAIVGMSCKVPGSNNVRQLWDNLCNGVEAISHFTNDELAEMGVDPLLLKDSNYIKAKGVLKNIDMFDADFFGFSPREAQIMDPQQRIFLENAWTALEDAGYPPNKINKSVGVFAGVGQNTYLLNNLIPHFGVQGLEETGVSIFNAANDFLSTLVSYKLNLSGPSLVIQTACSSSLVAIHLASQSILTGECDMAVAGGIAINVPQEGYYYLEGGIFSKDGHCRTFDSEASGTVRSSGVGVIVIKRLEEAIEDNDNIIAVIRGSSINNDGSKKVGYTAPSIDGQSKVILDALTMSNTDPRSISFIEAHGTGTILGDPIEVSALSKAYEKFTSDKQFCAIGSIKSNIGHTGAPAGVIGLIKAALTLKHKQLPPSINFSVPNPKIDFTNSPFFVNNECLGLNEIDGPLRGAVSSFGIGGTNAHLILEEWDNIAVKREPQKKSHLFLLSAKTDTSLETISNDLINYLEVNRDSDIENITYTYQVGRSSFVKRKMFVCDNIDEAVKTLKFNNSEYSDLDLSFSTLQRDIIFMFPGQGAQYVNMAREIYQIEESFREDIDTCSEYVSAITQLDIRNVMFSINNTFEKCEEQIHCTEITQPILFIIEYALFRLYSKWGIRPKMMIGHSLGEYVAACVSGAISLKDTLRLVVARGKLMSTLDNGSMLSVPLSEIDVSNYLHDSLFLSSVNAPNLCVVSGKTEAIKKLKLTLKNDDIESMVLQTSHAFHSRLVDPIIDEFEKVLSTIKFNSPKIPWISNVTGNQITNSEIMDTNYWISHLREPVRFSDGLKTLINNDNNYIFLEVGPSETLSTLTRIHLKPEYMKNVFSSLPHPKRKISSYRHILTTIGRLWLLGVHCDWENFWFEKTTKRVSLPTYSFDRKSFWIDSEKPNNKDDNDDGLNTSINTNMFYNDTNGDLDIASKQHQIIVDTWKELLGIKSINIYDNFFELGGHSLLAIQLLSNIKNLFKVNISLNNFIENPTVNSLVRQIENSCDYQPLDYEQSVQFAKDKYSTFPMTSLAQSYWLGRQDTFEISNIGSHIYYEIKCENLDINKLEFSLQQLIERHDMLRATFSTNGQQKILKTPPAYKIMVNDWRNIEEKKQKSHLDSLREELEYKTNITAQWPLFDVRAILLNDQYTLICLKIDYLIIDALSLNVFFEEWAKLYNNPNIELEPLNFSYHDYILSELQFQETNLYLKSKKYWLDRIKTLPPAPQLPLKKSDKSILKPRLVSRKGKLDSKLWNNLKSLASRYNFTPSAVLCAVYAEVLAKWSENKHFTLNLPIYGRKPFHYQINKILGAFTSNILLEVEHTSEISFLERVKKIQSQLWADLDNRHFNGVEVLRERNREKGHNKHGTMPIIFTGFVNPYSNGEMKTTSYLGDQVYRSNQAPQILIDHQITEVDNELIFNWDSLDELFHDGVINDMFNSYRELLYSLSSKEGIWDTKQICALPVNHNLLIEDINQTNKKIPDCCLHELFINQVVYRKKEIAIQASNGSLTYEELYKLSCQLAIKIQEKGVSKNELIAVMMHKGWEQVVAVLGILMSGAAYLPIDPNFPVDRVHKIMKIGKVKKAIVQPSLQKFCLNEVSCITVQNNNIDEFITPIQINNSPDDLAYVIFTSGSTGEPKGVMISHNNAVNTIIDTNTKFSVTSKDKLLALSSLGFDLSVYDIFGILAIGGTIVFPNPELEKEPEHWEKIINQYKISIWNSVPALMEMYLEHLNDQTSSENNSLRLVLLSGDKIPLSLPDKLKRNYPSIKIISLGGATEASIWSIYYTVNQVDPEWNSIPYGRPLSNQTIYVMDKFLNNCPVQVTGELFIGGAGVAKGYWDDKNKTEMHFITHPITNEKLYRTGDLGRYLPNGNIEFLGRSDNQVKINGFRIELEEIEKNIMKHHDILDGVVIADSNKKITAFIVPDINKIKQGCNENSERDIINSWKDIFSYYYTNSDYDNLSIPENNFSGWKSSYTNENIPIEDMEEWINCTNNKIRSLKPKKILEIGCGTGLLLNKLAESCDYYYGTDVSATAIKQLEKYTDTHNVNNVKLIHAEANEFDFFHGEMFDLIIINSVVQYFPSVKYLLEVIENSLNHLVNGGKLFIGDIRDLSLLKAFNASVQFHKNQSINLRDLCEIVETNVFNERELVIDPNLFKLIKSKYKHISDVEITPKFGRRKNEMNDFRYDVIIQKGNKYTDQIKVQCIDSNDLHLSINKIKQDFLNSENGILGISNITNASISRELKLVDLMGKKYNLESNEIKNELHNIKNGVQPVDIMELGKEIGCNVKFKLKRKGVYDVILYRQIDGKIVTFDDSKKLASQAYEEYVTRPYVKEYLNNYEKEIKNQLKAKLPEYMLPDTYYFIKKIPFTLNGKIDRSLLETLMFSRNKNNIRSSSPKTSLEKTLCDIWSKILMNDNVGINDNFFDLNGDSIIATTLVSEIRSHINTNIPLRMIFEFPTIATLAVKIEELETYKEKNEDKISDILQSINNLTNEEITEMLKNNQ